MPVTCPNGHQSESTDYCDTCGAVIATLFLWARATFPRFRYDQIMRLGWKIFIPVTLVWLILIAIWMQTPLNIWK